MCQDVPCDCEWNPWTVWSPCDKDCNGGVRERTRTFTPGEPGGEPCDCETYEKEYCNMQPCTG